MTLSVILDYINFAGFAISMFTMVRIMLEKDVKKEFGKAFYWMVFATVLMFVGQLNIICFLEMQRWPFKLITTTYYVMVLHYCKAFNMESHKK